MLLNKIVAAIMNWVAASLLVPLGVIIGDYFKMKKTIKELNNEINSLKAAKTKDQINEAINKLP